MPAHNFMLEDLYGVLKAICLFPIFLFCPGYVAAWLLDLLDFRRRTAAFRAAFSLLLSIGLCPILTYWLGRFAGMRAVLACYVAAAALFFILLVLDVRRRHLHRPLWPARSGVFAAIACVWLAVALLSLIDLQIGDRLYYAVSTVDYALHTELVHSISTTGLPAANPFFLPGHPVPLRYHYFWPMMCSLVNQLRGSAVSARQALIGGTYWAGIGLMALVLVYLRVFLPGNAEQFRRRALTCILLLGITGLDIVPSLFLLLLYAKGVLPFLLPSVEAWNEPVDWFLYTTVWTPHTVAALIASFTGFLLVWQSSAAPRRSGMLRYAVPGGIALASSVGCSIYLTLVFASFLVIWTLVAFWKKLYRETAGLVVAGVTMIALALPYLRDLTGPGQAISLFRLTVRAFPLAALIRTPGLSAVWRLVLVNGTLLPLNYLLEFGFFFLVARYKWRRRRVSGEPLSRPDLACALMLATSVLICTFVRSDYGFNDLGWRGMVVAEFVLLLWAADVFPKRGQLSYLSAHQRGLMMVFVALGVAGSVYDLSIARVYPILADRGVLPPLDWMSPDRAFGKRTYAARAAYEWLQHATPETAAVQANPKVVFEDALGMIYGERPAVAADLGCLAVFGGDPKECPPLVSRLQEIFPPAGRAASAGIQEVCGALPVDVLVAKDTDSAWSDRRSWVWREKPVYANRYVRMFRCGLVTARR
ncbi:MAG: hypothetical protein ABSC05_09085 [Candidatus Solibacter sp.]|jgi:hypothetical protein